MRQVHRFKTKDEASDFLLVKWIEISRDSIKRKGVFTAALSGGTTPAQFYRKLASCGQNLPWEKTHLFLADERFVPVTHEDSNYRLINESLLGVASMTPSNIHGIPVEERPASSAASKYSDEITGFFNLKTGELPVFDLIMLGIGDDGHTASLFPGHLFLEEKIKPAVSVNYEKVKHERVTLTFSVINNAMNVVILAGGQNKKDIVEKMLRNPDEKIPASLVSPSHGNLYITIYER